MKTKSPSLSIVMLSLILTLIVTMACSLGTVIQESESEDASIQQTLVALQQTQIALDNQMSSKTLPPTEPQETTPIEVPTNPLEEIIEEQPDVLFEDISFSFDPSIATSIFPSTIPEQNFGDDYMPGDTYPNHFEFEITGYAVPDHFHDPIIRVYPVEEYRAISTYAGNIIDNLKQTLITRPAGGSPSSIPFLPMWNAAQVFSAKVAYFDFQNGSGIRFVTMYGQALYPVDNQNLFYTYQGITSDGRYYLSAILPITHPGLPNQGQIADWEAFNANWQPYINDTINWLVSQEDNGFTPSLEYLDEIMASFKINR